ncbi:recombinase family protein [Proteiniborus sp. MB09-C3]|uniref:recombinase family protein n=1 Tax=Proteiniborus sp. MB09-C3 TaxID=3050072 RepID=UPI00255686EF|nr:recombinase family protein [Proteiniborus sp. MB09-C3]WIV13940.1 recombinase family protein [Proteiniborus sp. MB09-C3]
MPAKNNQSDKRLRVAAYCRVSTEHEEQRQRLMKDCRDGKVDLILMKSLSRFGRNTLDVLLMLDELSKLTCCAI